jgi:hypothetical protein
VIILLPLRRVAGRVVREHLVREAVVLLQGGLGNAGRAGQPGRVRVDLEPI